jgi:hypothetical protein
MTETRAMYQLTSLLNRTMPMQMKSIEVSQGRTYALYTKTSGDFRVARVEICVGVYRKLRWTALDLVLGLIVTQIMAGIMWKLL